MFLSHWFDEAYRHQFGKQPPDPYPLAHLNGHVHRIYPPNRKCSLDIPNGPNVPVILFE